MAVTNNMAPLMQAAAGRPAAAAAPVSAQAAPPNYQAAFQNALASARGNINAQLGAALGDISQSRQAAGEALGQLPGGINAAYNQQQNTVNNALGAIQQAQQKSGIGSLMPVSAFMQPEMAAVQGSRQADLANVPLLNVGIQQQANQQDAAAQMAAMGDQSALDQSAMSMYANQANQQQQYQNNLALQNAEDAAKLKEINAQTGTTQVTNAQGIPQGYTQADMQAAIQSPQYARAAQLIQSNAGDPQQLAQVWNDLQNLYRSKPALIQALSSVLPGGKNPGGVPSGPASSSYFGIDLGSGARNVMHRAINPRM